MSNTLTDWQPQTQSVVARLGEVLAGLAASAFLFALVSWTISTNEIPQEQVEQSNRIDFAIVPPPPVDKQRDELPAVADPQPYRQPIDLSSEQVDFELDPLSVELTPVQNIDTLSKINVDFSDLMTTREELDSMVVYRRKELDRGLVAIYQPMPKISKRTSSENYIRLLFVVGKDGRVTDQVYILESSDPDLNEEIVAGVKTWQFSPPKRDGVRVRARGLIRLNISKNNASPWGL